MNAIAKAALPTIGTAYEGGFFAGLFTLNGDTYGLVVSHKADGEVAASCWGDYPQNVEGAISCNDGLANTQAMAKAGAHLATRLLALDINDFTDWYLPSRDELELLYRNLKPTAERNYCSFRDGDNPSSLPAGYPYTAEAPGQVDVQAFADGGAEAFEPRWYWASTQSSPYVACIQDFDDGGQGYGPKDNETRARAVRRFKVTP